MDKIQKKQFCFWIDPNDHSKLRIKLKYDSVSQNMFFNYIVKGYLEEDPLIIKYMLKVAQNRKNKSSYKKRLKDNIDREKINNDFGLNDEEIENIFDLIEKQQGES